VTRDFGLQLCNNSPHEEVSFAMRLAVVFFILLLALTTLVGCQADSPNADDGDMAPPPTVVADDDDDDDDDDDNDDDDDDDDNDDDDDDDNNDDDNDTPDPGADPDRDGIPTGEEWLDGTDPFDPSDARAWHPELGGHPRLFAGSSEWLAARKRYQDGDEESVRLFNRFLSTANRAPRVQDPDAYSFGFDQVNGFTASAAAVAALVLDDPTYAQKAVDITTSLNFDLNMWRIEEWDHGTILGSTALVNFCLAFDLLVGFELVTPADAEAMRTALLDYTRMLQFLYVTIPIAKFVANNHVIKLCAGFAVVGMTFNDIPDAARWVNLGVTSSIHTLLEFQMPPGGGQAEGPIYLDYSFTTFAPFSAAYHHFAQGEDYPYKLDCRTYSGFPCSGDIVQVTDPVVDPRLDELLDWRMALSMPGGYAAPLDDSSLSCGQPGLIATLYDRPDFAWAYRETAKCTFAGSSWATLEWLYQPLSPAPAEPPYNAVFMPEAGQAVLRTGWAATDLFALQNGEHGRARLAGIGHEQADATSFILHALGEFFVIDSGYPGYADRRHTCFGDNHNVILIDGAGPPIGLYYALADADAYLDDFVESPELQASRVSSTYAGANLERRLALIGDDYFITSDLVEAESEHTFTWLMHTLTGGDTDGVFTLLEDGVLLERPGGVLRTHIQSLPGPPDLREGENEHSLGHHAIETHAVLEAETSSQRTRFLAVHLPAGEAELLPTVTPFSDGSQIGFRIAGEDFVDVISAGDDVALPPGVVGDAGRAADMVWQRLDPLTLEPISWHVFYAP
jgi:Heparinase II/III-like protein